jgi:hypothetical protein
MNNLAENSIILFGSVYPAINKFYIDTIFVVNNSVPANEVQINNGSSFTQTYRESTLEQLNEYLKIPQKKSSLKVYTGKKWYECNNFFSFVPCKTDIGDNGFERFYINLDDSNINLSRNTTGISYLDSCNYSTIELWNFLISSTTEQGFKLGIQFSEP